MPIFLHDLIDLLRYLLELARPFAPFATAAAGLLAGAVAWRAYRQRRVADNRAEWWKRAQFAIDLTCMDDDKVGRNTGMALLSHLLRDRSATRADAEMLEGVVDALVNEVVNHVSSSSTEPAATGRTSFASKIIGRIRMTRRRQP